LEGYIKDGFNDDKTISREDALTLLKNDMWMMQINDETLTAVDKMMERQYGKPVKEDLGNHDSDHGNA